LDETFNVETIETITDSGIQTILLNHLNQLKYQNATDEKGKPIAAELVAFSPDGIDEMNNNIVILNNGKFHQPIFKVRITKAKGEKFAVGQRGNKKDKYVIAAKGTNLFFAIYKDTSGKRNYTSIPFNEVLEMQKQNAMAKEKPVSVPLKNEKGDALLLYLSPNDLVYIPSEDEKENINSINFNCLNKEQVNRIYKVVSFTGTQCFFIKSDVSASIVNKVEFSPLNKMEKSIEGIMIKECCIKLKVDRLGNISLAKKNYNENNISKGEGPNVNEPNTEYQTKQKLRFFQSMTEMNESDAQDMALLPFKERLRKVVDLILRNYGLSRIENQKSPKNHTLTFQS